MLSDLHGLRAPRARSGQKRGVQRGFSRAEAGLRRLRRYSEPSASFTKREITEARLSKCVVMIPR